MCSRGQVASQFLISVYHGTKFVGSECAWFELPRFAAVIRTAVAAQGHISYNRDEDLRASDGAVFDACDVTAARDLVDAAEKL
jgi:hypothetical protein